jgi:hypothetical protein
MAERERDPELTYSVVILLRGGGYIPVVMGANESAGFVRSWATGEFDKSPGRLSVPDRGFAVEVGEVIGVYRSPLRKSAPERLADAMEKASGCGEEWRGAGD